MAIKLVILCTLSYLLGSISVSYLIGKKYKNIDIREHGSGNIGTTNTFRVLGKKLGVLTFLFDFFKAFIPTIIALKYFYPESPEPGLIVGIFAVLGHNFPVFMNFKGGKGVASSIGVVMAYDTKIALIAVAIFTIVVLTLRMVSLGSISAAGTVGIWYIYRIISSGMLTGLGVVFMAVLLVIRHKDNIKRLLRGEEKKIVLSKGDKR